MGDCRSPIRARRAESLAFPSLVSLSLSLAGKVHSREGETQVTGTRFTILVLTEIYIYSGYLHEMCIGGEIALESTK